MLLFAVEPGLTAPEIAGLIWAAVMGLPLRGGGS